MPDIFNDIQNKYTVSNPAAVKQSETVKSDTQQVTIKEAMPAAAQETKTDTVELSTKEKTKKGPIRTIKGCIANIKKFVASTGEYAKGTAKGIAAGAVAGSLVYTGGSIINYCKSKAAKNAGAAVKNVPNKALAGVAAGIAIAANIWNASLNATERSSSIDHRWTGHQNNN